MKRAAWGYEHTVLSLGLRDLHDCWPDWTMDAFATFLVLKTLLQLASNYVVLRCMYVDHDDTNYI